MFPFSAAPQIRTMDFVRRLLLSGLTSCLLVLPFITRLQAEEFQLVLADGNVIIADVANKQLNWRTINVDGSVEERSIQLSSVTRLTLADAPASDQSIEVRKLLGQLSDPDYFVREAAEQQLLDEGKVGPFKGLIESLKNSKDLEVRVRAERILNSLDDSSLQKELQLDAIRLNNQDEIIEGDAGQFVLTATLQGNALTIPRNQLMSINAVPPAPDVVATGQLTPEAKLFYDVEQFQPGNLRTVDFEVTPSGESIEARDSVETVYQPFGLVLETEEPGGEVVVSTFSFGNMGTVAKSNSIAVYAMVQDTLKRFKGVCTVEFCVPGQPWIPAAVNEFGLFIARVDNGRNFIMEGYDKYGRLIAQVDAPDERCGFMGIKSQIPIAKIRVLANPYLHRLTKSRIIDDDYGLDHFVFSKPRPIGLATGASNCVLTNRGEIIDFETAEFAPEQLQIKTRSLGELTFEFSELAEIRFQAQPTNPNPASGHWLATLTDGNRLTVTGFDPLTSDSIRQPIAIEQLASLRFSSQPERFPVAGDFEKTGKVLVFPTCRIVPEILKFEQNELVWGPDSIKILQPVDGESPLDVPGKDPTPVHHQVPFESPDPTEIPTAWMSNPPTWSSQTTEIWLQDGQRFLLNETSPFKLDSVRPDSITLTNEGQKIEIPAANLLRIVVGDWQGSR